MLNFQNRTNRVAIPIFFYNITYSINGRLHNGTFRYNNSDDTAE
jgi:hypothetical protein